MKTKPIHVDLKKCFLAFGAALLFMLSACNPVGETPGIEDPVPSPIIWKTPTEVKNTAYGYASVPYIVDSVLLICLYDGGNDYKVKGLHSTNGSVIWQKTTDDFPPEFHPTLVQETSIKGSQLVLSSSGWVVCLDAFTGNEQWRSQQSNPGPSFNCIIDNWVYKSTKAAMLRINIQSGQSEEVFNMNQHLDFGSPLLLMPVKWDHPSGDEILIMQNRVIQPGKKMAYMAYNITVDSMLWYKTYPLEPPTTRPLLEGNNLYIFGSYSPYLVNPLNGDIRWSFILENPLLEPNIVTNDNRLILKPSGNNMFAINKLTGKEIWKSSNTTGAPYFISSQTDTLYYTNNAIIGVDANTGEKIIDWALDYPSSFRSAITADPETGYIYTTDGIYVYCLDPKHMGLE